VPATPEGYWYVRPSATYPTVEVRTGDVCATAEDTHWRAAHGGLEGDGVDVLARQTSGECDRPAENDVPPRTCLQMACGRARCPAAGYALAEVDLEGQVR
jgi:hypothetical protein